HPGPISRPSTAHHPRLWHYNLARGPRARAGAGPASVHRAIVTAHCLDAFSRADVSPRLALRPVRADDLYGHALGHRRRIPFRPKMPGWRTRLAYFFSWFGTQKIRRSANGKPDSGPQSSSSSLSPSSSNLHSSFFLLPLSVVVFALAIAGLKSAFDA